MPAVLKTRSIVRPLPLPFALAAPVLTVSVMLSPRSRGGWLQRCDESSRVMLGEPGRPLPHDLPGRLWVSPSWRADRGSRSFEPQHRDLGVEVVGRLERAVDAREAEVGHLVERAQRGEDREPDLVGVELGLAAEAQRVLDVLAEARELGVGDRAALAGLADAGDRLVAVERLGRAGALEHRELHLLDRREAAVALRARTTAADRTAVVGDPGVEDLGVLVLAVGTVHGSLLLSGASGRARTPSVGVGCGDVPVDN